MALYRWRRRERVCRCRIAVSAGVSRRAAHRISPAICSRREWNAFHSSNNSGLCNRHRVRTSPTEQGIRVSVRPTTAGRGRAAALHQGIPEETAHPDRRTDGLVLGSPFTELAGPRNRRRPADPWVEARARLRIGDGSNMRTAARTASAARRRGPIFRKAPRAVAMASPCGSVRRSCNSAHRSIRLRVIRRRGRTARPVIKRPAETPRAIKLRAVRQAIAHRAVQAAAMAVGVDSEVEAVVAAIPVAAAEATVVIGRETEA